MTPGDRTGHRPAPSRCRIAPLKAQRRVSGVDRTGNHVVSEGVAGEGWVRGLVADTRKIRFPEVFTEAESVCSTNRENRRTMRTAEET